MLDSELSSKSLTVEGILGGENSAEIVESAGFEIIPNTTRAFNLRKNGNTSFDTVVDFPQFYYRTDGSRNEDVKLLPDADGPTCKSDKLINGIVKEAAKNSNLPDDFPDQRSVRISTFEKSADARQSAPYDGYDDIDVALRRGEKILVSLDCSEISGLPSTTADDVFTGAIKVSVVEETETKAVRVFFTVLEGSVELSVKENFYDSDSFYECICCCIPVSLDFIGHTVYSKSDMKYTRNVLRTAQFCTLPANPCVLDAMCYRSTKDEFSATSRLMNVPTPPGKPCTCDFSICFKYPCACESRPCCEFLKITDNQELKYEACASAKISEGL